MKNGACACGASSCAEHGKLLGVLIGPINPSWLCWRQLFGTSVVAAGIERLGWVLHLAYGFAREIVFGVCEVVSHKIRPAIKTGLAGLVDLVIPAGAAGAVFARVRSDFAPVKPACFWVDIDPPGIAATHDVDFGAAFGAVLGEEVALGNGVTALSGRANAQNLAHQIVGVCGSALRVPRFPFRLFVCGGITVGAKRIGVVSGGVKQVALRIEHHGACVVTALKPLLGRGQKHLF